MTRETSEHLAVGNLVLDQSARELVGPSASVSIAPTPYRLARALMRKPGVVIGLPDLIAACWPDPDFEPDSSELCIRNAVLRVRAAMEKAGVDPRLLRSVARVGYAIDGAPRIVRTFSPDQAAALERLISTHPDSRLAALVAA